ncbi:MAG: hypothetical protein WD749_00510 [Phycisphaerales bacterium]
MRHASPAVSGLAALTLSAGAAVAQTAFYERATLGTTGITSGSGIAVTNLFYTGWRFEVTNGPIETVSIGGHFFQGSGSVFGALVQLTDPNDHPDNVDLTSPDVIATNLVPLPPSGGSNEAQGPMTVTLQNGWYLVVFGSGNFGATATSGGLVAQDPATAVPGVQLNITYRQAIHPSGPGIFLQGSVARCFVEYSTGPAPCYANCDESTQAPVLNVADFGCFLTRYAAGEAYANCDESTQAPVLNVADFGCFLTKYAAGCP